MRESKKAERKASIENVALELFSQLGFTKTSISMIAERAGLGTGTVYNYFKTKEDILFSIIEKRSSKYIEELDRIIINKSLGLTESVILFHDTYLNSLSLYNKNIWKECVISIFSGDSKLMERIHEIDKPYIERLITLFMKFQQTGVLRPHVNVTNLVTTLYAADMFAILIYIADESMPITFLKTELKKHIDLVTT